MGSIKYVYEPNRWKTKLLGKSKITEGDTIFEVVIGSWEDEFSSGDLVQFMSKDSIEGILSGKYMIKTFPYCEQQIIILDENKNIIPLVKGKEDTCYSITQKEYIAKIRVRI